MAHLSSQNLTQKPTSHDSNFRPRLRLQKQSLTTPPLGCRVHHAARATRHWELAATQRTEFESNQESSTSAVKSCARLPADLRPHRHPWCHHQSTWSAQKGTEGIYRRRGKMAYRKRYVYAIIYKPQSSKNLALVGGRPYYHLDGANAKYLLNLKKS